MPTVWWKGVLGSAPFLLALLGSIAHVLFLLQWKAVIREIQAPLLWNGSGKARARRHSENITFHGVLMGLYFEPYAKLLWVRKWTLGLPVVLHLDSSLMARQFPLASKDALWRWATLLSEEMWNLRMETPSFEIPVGSPDEEADYREMMYWENFDHCFFVDFGTDRIWSTWEIVTDHCERPRHKMEEALPQWYLNITGMDYGYRRDGRYEGAKREEYHIPGGKRLARAAAFCTTDLYRHGARGDTQARALGECLQNETTGELKEACLPHGWHDGGESHFFREMTDEDFCQRPRFPAFLNWTYFEQSCTAGWCGETPNCPLPKNQDWDCLFCSWSHKLDLPYWGRDRHDPSWCVRSRRITRVNYADYSLLHFCLSRARHVPIDEVVSVLRQGLEVPQEAVDFPCDHEESRCLQQHIPDMVQAEAVWVLNATFSDFQNIRKDRRRVRKGAASVSKAMVVLSRLSDMNDHALKGGILFIQNYLIAAFGIVQRDIATLSEALALESLHVLLMKCVLRLSREQAPWFLLHQTEIQRALWLSDQQMQIVRHTAKAHVYDVQEQRDQTSTRVWNPDVASRWNIRFYLELHVPGEFYRTNWKLENVGWLVATGKHMALTRLVPPFRFISLLQWRQRFLAVRDCTEDGYLFCEEVSITVPCSTEGSGSNCPVTLRPVPSSYLKIRPLNNGSYLILSALSDCGIPVYRPSVVTVATSRVCFGQTLFPPWEPASLSQPMEIKIPILDLRFPLLVGIIAHLREVKIVLFNTFDPVEEILQHAEHELNDSHLHEWRWAEWLGFLHNALSQLGPGVSRAARSLTQLVVTWSEGALGTVFDGISDFKWVLVISMCFALFVAQLYRR